MAALRESAAGFHIDVEWQPADGVTVPELAATWCRLEIQVAGRQVTTVEDGRTNSIRRGIYTSAYPLAEWIAEHWWALRAHVRPSMTPQRFWAWTNVTNRPWLRAHNLRGAGGGLPWPDLTIVPEGSVTRLAWTAGDGLTQQPVTFLTSGQTCIPTDHLSDALARFVDQVVVRLTDTGLTDTPLHKEWHLIAISDEEESAFAIGVARLGLDPYDVPDDLADDVIALSENMDDALLAEFLDSVHLPDLRLGHIWVQRAQQMAETRDRPDLDPPIGWPGTYGELTQASASWRVGYAAAASYRQQLGRAAEDLVNPADFVGATFTDAASAGIEGLVVAHSSQVGLVVPTGALPGDSSMRFAQARALGLSLLTPREIFVLDPTSTDLAKASRAFAAEFLAPAEGIRTYLAALPDITPQAFEAVASRFQVSPVLVTHQYDNQVASPTGGPGEVD